MLKLFTPFLKRSLSTVLSSAILLGSLPFTATTATAGPLCSDTAAANQGRDPNCAARVVGNQIVTYPRSVWREIANVKTSADGTTTVSSSWLEGNMLETLGDKNATALGLDAKDVVSMITMMPTNLPHVYARYNPLTGTLRVDLMKVENKITPSGKETGLYSSPFTPQHGNFWKASRQYISPDQYESGTVPGMNPFERFTDGSSDLFSKVTQEGTQVIVGHAMRFSGAPMAVMQVAIPDVKTHSWKSGNAFRKKVTTVWTGYLKPTWWLGYPTTLLDRDSTMSSQAYCIRGGDDCPRYELATAGVSFEEFKGGMLDGTVESWELDRQTKSGFGFLGLLLVFTAIAFAGFGLLSLVAPATFGTLAGGLASLTGFGALGGTTALGAAGLTSALGMAGMMIFGGANLGGMYSLDMKFVLFGIVTAKNTQVPTDLDKYSQWLSERHIEPRTVSDFITGGITSVSWQRSVTGTCGANQSVESCGGGVSAGVIPRYKTSEESYVPVVQTQMNLSAPSRVNTHTGNSGYTQQRR